MVGDVQRRFEALRRSNGDPLNHIVDEWCAGSIDRRTFLRHATTLGLTLPFALALAPPSADAARTRRATTTTTTTPAGSVLRIAIGSSEPVSDPWTTTGSRVLVVGLVGDHLVRSSEAQVLSPGLATSWRPDDSMTQWTFVIRDGVRFHNGARLTADDVAASFRRLLNPAAPTIAGAHFAGILSPAGVQRVDRLTVRFRLASPCAAFPLLVSDANPSAVIVPTGWVPEPGRWFVGSGSWLPTAKRLTPFPRAWEGTGTAIRSVELIGGDPVTTYVQNESDLVVDVAGADLAVLRSSAESRVLSSPTFEHLQLHLRSNGEFTGDRRIRLAIAAAIDRVAARAVAGDAADPVDDVPLPAELLWSPLNRPVPVRNVGGARQLLRDANRRRGFDLSIASDDSPVSVGVVRALMTSLADVNIRITHAASATYHDQSWLKAEAGLTRFAHRPHVAALLSATLSSDGSWNAARYRNSDVDAALRTLSTSADLDAQRRAAATLQQRLTADRPLIVPFFVRRLAVVRARFPGLRLSAGGLLDVGG